MRHRRARRVDAAPTPSPPPQAGEGGVSWPFSPRTGAFPRLRGKVGGSVRREIVERGDLMRPPTPAPPRTRGRGPGLNLLPAHRRLPPRAGQGGDGSG